MDSHGFYISFADEMRENLLSLTQKLIILFINSNKIIQIFESKDEKPFKTFEYIHEVCNVYN